MNFSVFSGRKIHFFIVYIIDDKFSSNLKGGCNMALPDHFLQELKSRCDISDVVSSYVNLKRRGRNLVGLCPFHSEKTPSFNSHLKIKSKNMVICANSQNSYLFPVEKFCLSLSLFRQKNRCL